MRKLLSAATAIAVLMSFTGCINKESTPNPTNSTSNHTDILSPSEKKEPVVLTYAVATKPSKEEQAVIDKFNETDNGYMVEVKDYSVFFDSKNSEWWQISEENQKIFNISIVQDISQGEVDIIRDKYLGGSTNTMDIFANKGFLLDLYQFMNEDNEINQTTLNSHILQLHETDGSLYMLPTFYMVDTLIGETRYVGEKENWSVDDMISYWEKMPEGSKIDGRREKDYVYMTILRGSLNYYVDYKKGTSSFNSPQFRKTLEFCNTFDTPLNYYNEQAPYAINFVRETVFTDFTAFHNTLYYFKNEPVTFVGYPSEDNSGSYIDSIGNRFAVCASVSDEKKQGAWEFLKMFAMEEYQTDFCMQTEDLLIDGTKMTAYYGDNGFPINLDVYNTIAENTINGKYVNELTGEDYEEDDLGLLTHEELNRLTTYINSVPSIKTNIDNDLSEIIKEEILSYFNNEKSIDETISNIQNKAELMVSEKQ